MPGLRAAAGRHCPDDRLATVVPDDEHVLSEADHIGRITCRSIELNATDSVHFDRRLNRAKQIDHLVVRRPLVEIVLQNATVPTTGVELALERMPNQLLTATHQTVYFLEQFDQNESSGRFSSRFTCRFTWRLASRFSFRFSFQFTFSFLGFKSTCICSHRLGPVDDHIATSITERYHMVGKLENAVHLPVLACWQFELDWTTFGPIAFIQTGHDHLAFRTAGDQFSLVIVGDHKQIQKLMVGDLPLADRPDASLLAVELEPDDLSSNVAQHSMVRVRLHRQYVVVRKCSTKIELSDRLLVWNLTIANGPHLNVTVRLSYEQMERVGWTSLEKLKPLRICRGQFELCLIADCILDGPLLDRAVACTVEQPLVRLVDGQLPVADLLRSLLEHTSGTLVRPEEQTRDFTWMQKGYMKGYMNTIH